MKKPPRVLPRKPRVAQPTNETAVFAAENSANFDNRAVNSFSHAMRVKLAAKRLEGRGGWQDKQQCSNEYLSQLLREHVEKGDPVDVANLAMMIHQRGERVSQAPAANALLPVTAGQGVEIKPITLKLLKDYFTAMSWGDVPDPATALYSYLLMDGYIPKSSVSVETYARSALAHQPLSAPEGWQLVPVEPTAEMHRAGWDKTCAIGSAGGASIIPSYRAMLAAAPKYTGGGEPS